jgi:predicted  nucleic acid-binding Zn-ribbon protein
MRIIRVIGHVLMAATLGAWPALAFPLPAGVKPMNDMAHPVAMVAQAINEHPRQSSQRESGLAKAAAPRTGELAAIDIEKAILLIAELGDIFKKVAEGPDDAPDKASWARLHETYEGAAQTLRNLLTAGRIEIRDLMPGTEGTTVGHALIIDSTLDGRWHREAVETKRRLGEEDWTEISALAGVLIQQLALPVPSARWHGWLEIHAQDPSFRSLPLGEPEAALKPHLVRIWHIGDKYLANQIWDSTAEAGPTKERWKDRDIALHNEMLAALRRLEQEIGWDWRDRLETAWGHYQARVRNLVAGRNGLPAKPPEAQPAEAAPGLTPAVRRLAEAPEAEAVDPAELRREIEALRQAMRVRDREIGVFKDLLESTRAKGDELGALLEAQTVRLEALFETLPLARDIRTTLERVSARQAGIEAQLAELLAGMPQDLPREEPAQFRDWIERQQNRAATLEESLGALSSRLGSTEGQVAGVREGLASLGEEMTELGERQHEEATALGAQVAELLAKVEPEAVRAEMVQLRGMMESLQAQSAQFEGRLTDMSSSLQTIGQEVAKSRVAFASVLERTAGIAQRLAEIETGPREAPLRQEIEAARSALEARSARLEEALADLSTEVSATGQQVTELRADLTSLRETTKELGTQLHAEAAQRQLIILTAFGAALLLALALVAAVLLRARREPDHRSGAAGQLRHATGFWEVPVTEKGVPGTEKHVPGAETPGPAAAAHLERELGQLGARIEHYSGQVAELAQRVTEIGVGLEQIQDESRRSQEGLRSIREGATKIGKSLLDQVASRDALRKDLDQLREELGRQYERVKTAEVRPDERQAQGLEAEISSIGDRETPPESTEGEGIQPSPTPAAPKPEPETEAAARIREQAVAALESEDIELFEESLARLTGLPLRQLQNIVRGPGGRDLAIACLAAQIEEAHFVTAFLLSRTDKARRKQADPLELSRAMWIYEQTSECDAKEILAKWRSAMCSEQGIDNNPARKGFAGEGLVTK